MLGLLIDTALLWFLLNVFSDQNWDDEKLRVFGIAVAIAFLGVLSTYAASQIGLADPFSALGVYFLVGAGCMKYLASISFGQAAKAMAVFIGIKLVFVIVIVVFLVSAQG